MGNSPLLTFFEKQTKHGFSERGLAKKERLIEQFPKRSKYILFGTWNKLST